MAQNALLASSAKFDLVGPTVDDDVRRIIARYGADAVKVAVANQTKARRGRPPEKDWPELHDFLAQDAIDWLNGKEPFSMRTNYWIAKQIAEKRPGHSAVSTHERIEKKLKKWREQWMLYHAEHISRDAYPYKDHLRALAALANKSQYEIWGQILERSLAEVEDYAARWGAVPPPEMTIKEIEHANLKNLTSLSGAGGRIEPEQFLGILSRYTSDES